MKIIIYQLPVEHGQCFRPFDDSVNYELIYQYSEVYQFEYSGEGLSAIEILDDIFKTFNLDRPLDFTSRSISVSDIVFIQFSACGQYWYCDTYGWKQIAIDYGLGDEDAAEYDFVDSNDIDTKYDRPREVLISLANEALANPNKTQEEKKEIFNSIKSTLCAFNLYKGYNWIKWVTGGVNDYFNDYPEKLNVNAITEDRNIRAKEKYMGKEWDRFFY